MTINFGSCCSGIEAASVAFGPLGWKAAWFSEIEPFPSAVLAHHYPEVPNLGDMTTIIPRVLSGEVDAPDVFTGGTPCQAFSVAGKRGSLADARGNLSLTFCEIANAIDDVRAADGREACIVVWENVPGVLSTSDNAFGCFLGALAGSGCELQPAGGRWTNAGLVLGPRRAVAWRIIDAQYFGLAQRRRRVFVVASARDGFDPAAVLFEFDGVRRDSAPSREAREGTTTSTARSVALRGREGGGTAELGEDCGLTLRASSGGWGGRYSSLPNVSMCPNAGAMGRQDAESETLIPTFGGGFDVAHSLRGEGFDASEDGTGRGTPLVPAYVPSVAATIVARSSRGGGQINSPGYNADPAIIALSSKDLGEDCRKPAVMLRDEYFCHECGEPCDTNTCPLCERAWSVTPIPPEYSTNPIAIRTAQTGSNGWGINTDGTAYTLDSAQQAVAFHPTQDPISSTDGTTHCMGTGSSGGQASIAVAFAQNQRNEVRVMNVAGALAAEPGAKQQTYMQQGMAVRRLTPRECEALQGFLPDYTKIPWRKKPAEDCPDGPRYKALGNSWAVPCVALIGRRIASALQLRAAA